jgi:hypothetical protein
VIVFGIVGTPLLRVPATGGVPDKVTVVADDRFPIFLPDGKRFLYDSSFLGQPDVFLGSLEAKPGLQYSRRIATSLGNAQYVPPLAAGGPGHLLFIREQTLMAQPVKPDSLSLVGDAFLLVEQVPQLPGTGYFIYSSSSNGVLAYLPGTEDRRQHTLFDRSGKQLSTIGVPVDTQGHVALSPDGKRMIWICCKRASDTSGRVIP